MKYLDLPIDCGCRIRQKENGRYEVVLYDLPHPCENWEQDQYAYGNTIEEVFTNMGPGISKRLFEEVPCPLIEDTL